MVAHNNTFEPTSWIRTEISAPTSVLLLASDMAPDAGIACRNLLTTVSERSESILVIEYCGSNPTWLDHLNREPTNMLRMRINDGDSLRRRIKEFVTELDEAKTGFVYVDSLSALVADVGVENTAVVLADTVSILENADVTGFFRIDPDISDTARFKRLVGYTAAYVPEGQKWQVSPSENSG